MSDSPAVANLRQHQQQLDNDGVMVGVSRQAVCETLTEIDRLRAELARAHDGANITKKEWDDLRKSVEEERGLANGALVRAEYAEKRIAELERQVSSRLTQGQCKVMVDAISASAERAEAERDAMREMVRRTRTRLEFYCNEAWAGRMPSDAREFMRRIQCGFDSMLSEADDLARAALAPSPAGSETVAMKHRNSAEAERDALREAGAAALKDLEYFSRREGRGEDASRFASIYKLRAALVPSPAGRE